MAFSQTNKRNMWRFWLILYKCIWNCGITHHICSAMGYINKYDLTLSIKTIQNIRASSCNVVSYPKPSQMPAETNWTTYMLRLCQLATILMLFHSYSCVITRPEKGHRRARNKQRNINAEGRVHALRIAPEDLFHRCVDLAALWCWVSHAQSCVCFNLYHKCLF